jgi:hypothetical protein
LTGDSVARQLPKEVFDMSDEKKPVPTAEVMTVSAARYAQLRRDAAAIDEEMPLHTRAAAFAAARTVFERHDKVVSFSIRAYTPGFNDGDPCRFTFEAVAITVNGSTNPDYSHGDEEVDEDVDFLVPSHEAGDWRHNKKWDDERDELVQVAPPGWAAAVNETVWELFSKFRDDDLEREFGSSFALLWQRPADPAAAPELTEEWYDCGH